MLIYDLFIIDPEIYQLNKEQSDEEYVISALQTITKLHESLEKLATTNLQICQSNIESQVNFNKVTLPPITLPRKRMLRKY